MKKIYGIYGASGFGREVMPILKQFLYRHKECSYEVYFIDDSVNSEKIIHGVKVINFDTFKEIEVMEKVVSIAIADSSIRKKLTEKLYREEIEILLLEKLNTNQE